MVRIMEIKQEQFSYNSLNGKQKKGFEIYDILLKKAAVSRSDIVKITGINAVSVSNYIKKYMTKGLISEKGLDVSTGGRKPELIEINVKENYIIGADIGKDNMRFVISDLAMKPAEKTAIPTPTEKNRIAAAVINSIEEMQKRSGAQPSGVKAIGLALPSRNFISIDPIAEYFKKEVFVGGDAACAAFAERALNPQADLDGLLYIFSDTGCAVMLRDGVCFGAVYSDGAIQFSENNIPAEAAGEFRRQAEYTRPWDSRIGVAEIAKHEASRGVGTAIVNLAGGKIENITRKIVIEAARQGDNVAIDIINNVGINLGIRIAYLINLYSPKAVVVGGGLERGDELILGQIRKMVDKFALNKHSESIGIMTSVIGEDGVSMGALSLAAREIFLTA